ncbi:uncharacterized protein LOC130671520 isoform X1 [Microplitis mediator]|uniref:uncharacterized protein LOC130671520 isoform X1 n=1 Tax=Microplitis mediator TaxID=375433 RepID=UPI00255711A8|nr:uncharacterized protein LOC130671520 isoform X1 [Microplitis mediator]
MRPLDLIGFLLVLTLWSVNSQEDFDKNEPRQKYDPNSLEMNKKLMTLFLRLAYQTANRWITLKNLEKSRAEQRIDTELQNITISEIMKTQEKNDSEKPGEIQSRFFFPTETRALFDKINPISVLSRSASNLVNNPKEFAPNLGQTLVDLGNKALDSMNSSVRIISDQNSLLNATSLQNATEVVNRIAEEIPVGDSNNSSAPSLRFLGDMENNSSSSSVNSDSNPTNDADKIEQRNGALEISTVEPKSESTTTSDITKRETSVQSFNKTRNDNTSENFPSSNVTDPIGAVDRGNFADSEEVFGIKQLRDPRSSSFIESDELFEFKEDDSQDLEPLISNLKLSEIVDQISGILI